MSALSRWLAGLVCGGRDHEVRRWRGREGSSSRPACRTLPATAFRLR